MYLRTDQANDVTCSLEQVTRSVELAVSDPHNWKWAILAMHSALQGALVCQLSGTAQIGALDKKSIDAFLDYHERDRKGLINRVSLGRDELGVENFKPATKNDQPPQEKLANATILLKRLKNSNKRIEAAGKIIDVTSIEFSSFTKLNRLRNQFTHFPPTFWLIEFSGIKEILQNILAIIEKIHMDDWAFRSLDEDQGKRLEKALADLNSALNK